MNDNKLTILYERLSHEDGRENESLSIEHQESSADTYSADDVYFTRRNSENLPLDTSKVEGYLRNITNLYPANYVSYNVTDKELQAYGLDASELTITVDLTTGGEDGGESADSFVLCVSSDPEDIKAFEKAGDSDQDAEISAYIRIGEAQIVYKVSSGSYKKLAEASYQGMQKSGRKSPVDDQKPFSGAGSIKTLTPPRAGA